MKTTILHLSLIEGVGPATSNAIINYLSDNPGKDLYAFTVQDFEYFCGLPNVRAQKVVAGLRDRSILEKELLLLERHSVRIITSIDREYPSFLKHIHCPPSLLYVKGVLPAEMQAVAFVGSREATWYSKKMVETFIPPLVSQGWSIISGGARGADSMAHEAALNASGHTVAVLGSGLLRPYPLSNKKLFDRIAMNGGALVSIFPLMAEPTAGNFPARNRIISGMSVGCVVLQAARKSGALITAAYGLEQSREIFAIPGHFDDPLNAGAHDLIRQGAHLITTAQDIIDQLPPISGNGVRSLPPEKQEKMDRLSESQSTVLHRCSAPVSFDELCDQMSLPAIELNEILFELQLKGAVRQSAIGLWERTT